MLKCEDCSAEFEEPETIEDQHPYQNTYAVEFWAVCPCCHSVNFEEKEREY